MAFYLEVRIDLSRPLVKVHLENIDWGKVALQLHEYTAADLPGLFRATVCNLNDCPVVCDQNEPENDYHYCLRHDLFQHVVRGHMLSRYANAV